MREYDRAWNDDPNMPLSDRQLLHFLSQMPFVDSAELAGILGEPHATVHRGLTDLLSDGIVGRVSYGTTHLPSSQRYYLTANGIRRASDILGFTTPSDYVRAYPVSGGVADATHPPDGRGGRRLQTRRITLPRHRQATVGRGVPPQGPVRRHHHPPRRTQLRRGQPGPSPAATVTLRPAVGHSGVQLHARRLEATLVLPAAAPNRRTMRHCRHNDRDSYFHHMPKVNMRRRRRTRSALPNSLRAAARASCRHRTWSSLREAFRGSVSGGRVRRKSRSMAISESHRRTEALARSTRLPVASPPVRNCRHSATRSDAGRRRGLRLAVPPT